MTYRIGSATVALSYSEILMLDKSWGLAETMLDLEPFAGGKSGG